jgi:hypothetical protein
MTTRNDPEQTESLESLVESVRRNRDLAVRLVAQMTDAERHRGLELLKQIEAMHEEVTSFVIAVGDRLLQDMTDAST